MNEHITITRRDASTYQLSVLKGSLRQSLMADDYADITIQSSEPINFTLGDQITLFGATYKLNKIPPLEKISDTSYVYTPRFEGVIYDLLKAQFILFDNTGVAVEGDFDLMGDLQAVLTLLVQNLNRVYGIDAFTLGSIAATEAQNHTFSSENCLQVLQKICDVYQVEFSLVWQPGTTRIDIGAAGDVKGFTLKYGQGKGLYKLNRKSVNDKNVFTRLFAYGSDKNLPLNYRSFSRRLKLPANEQSYIEDAIALGELGLIEHTKTFDDIYPRRTGVISAVADKLNFTDSGMDFDLNASVDGNTLYMIAGNTPKISLLTGNLAGYEFEIASYDHSSKSFKIKPYKDDRGMELPGDSAAFAFAPGDEYVMLDIRMPDSYVTAAEAELSTRAQEYLNQGKTIKAQYNCEIEPVYAKKESLELRPGDSIPLEDTPLNLNRHFRVISLTRDILESYRWSIELGDEVTVSNLVRLYQNSAAVNTIIRRNNLLDPAVYRQSWRTTRELQSMIFDQEDYFDTTRIKPLSIETGMLTVGSVAGQFVLNSIVFQPNFNNVANRLKATAGTLSHYAIEDNIRIWNVAAFDLLLPDNNARYIYIRCQKDGATAEVRLETSQLKVNAVEGYYTFLVGVLHSVLDGFRRVSLSYGSTVVHGREIVTGRIASANGATYFDLDQGEIGGKIVFRSGKDDQQVESDISNAQSTAGDAAAAASNAQTTASNAAAAASNAQTTANNAQTAASGANALLSDIANDNKLTPAEKQSTKKEWDVIVSEKTKIENSAVYYGVVTTAYINAYNALSTYISPLLSSLTTTSDITGTTFRANFKAYYNARQDILNSISIAAKDLADAAQNTADTGINMAGDAAAAASNAQATANNAQATASGANALLSDIANDNKFTPGEKQSVKLEWDIITGEEPRIDAEAEKFGVSRTVYINAFDALSAYISPLLSSLTTTSDITGATFRSKFKAYYDARQDILNAITTAAKALADAAQTTANNALYKNKVQEYFDGVNPLASWINLAGSGELSILASSDATAGKLLRIGNNSGNDQAWLEHNVSIAFDPNKLYRVKARIRRTFGSGTVYVGIAGRNANDTGYVNISGSDTRYSQFFVAAGNQSPGTSWTDYVGYFKGHGDPVSGENPNPSNPALLHPNCRYFRVYIVVNYSSATGITEIDSITVEEAEFAEAEYLKTALAGSTDISGGLLATNVLLMKTAEGVISGGLSGLGNDNIGMWTGGTYQQAIQSLAKVIMRKDGSGQLAGGRIKWTMGGDLYVGDLFVDSSGAIVMRDTGGVIRTILTRTDITTLGDIAGSTQNTTINNNSNYYTGSGNYTYNFPNSIVVNYNSSEVTVNCNLSSNIYEDVPGSRGDAELQLFLYNTATGVSTKIEELTNRLDMGSDGNAAISVNKTVVMPAGTYKLRIQYSHFSLGGCSFMSSVSSNTVNVFFDGSSQRTEVGKNGIGIIGNANNYSFFGMEGGVYKVVEKCSGVYDRPGLLATGSIASNGSHPTRWGAKASTSNATYYATGIYYVHHSVGSTDYMVSVTPIGDGLRAHVTAKYSTYFRVQIRNASGTAVTGAFDYQITGNN